LETSQPANTSAIDMTPPDGILSRRSPVSVGDTVAQIASALEANGVKLFATIDHSGEAERVGLTLRETKLLIFGNPAAGTPLMEENPLIALDLPLKVLVWHDQDNKVWMSHLAGPWLAERYGIEGDLAKVLSAVEGLVDHIAGPPS
jgi:uncharacterized protein (DUF302 family)